MIQKKSVSKNLSFNEVIKESLNNFLLDHKPHWPKNLYDLVISEVEKTLLKLTLEHTTQNKSEAAKILGLNRATLNKKLAKHQLSNTEE